MNKKLNALQPTDTIKSGVCVAKRGKFRTVKENPEECEKGQAVICQARVG